MVLEDFNSLGILLGRLFSRCMLFRRHFYLFGEKIMYFSEDAFWNWTAFLTNRARVITYTNVWNIILSIFRSPKIIFVGLKSVICMSLNPLFKWDFCSDGVLKKAKKYKQEENVMYIKIFYLFLHLNSNICICTSLPNLHLFFCWQ